MQRRDGGQQLLAWDACVRTSRCAEQQRRRYRRGDLERVGAARARARQVWRPRLGHRGRYAVGGGPPGERRAEQPVSCQDREHESRRNGQLSAGLCRCHRSTGRERSAGRRLGGERGRTRRRARQLSWCRGCGGHPARRHQGRLQQPGTRGRAECPGRELRQYDCRLALPLSDHVEHQSGHDHARSGWLHGPAERSESGHELLGASGLGNRGSDARRQR